MKKYLTPIALAMSVAASVAALVGVGLLSRQVGDNTAFVHEQKAKLAEIAPKVEANAAAIDAAETPAPTVYAKGWEDRPDVRAAIAPTLAKFADTPAYKAVQGDESDVYLWKSYVILYGRPPPERNQGQVGSCVSFGTAAAIEASLATQIVQGGVGDFKDVCQEAIYGGSRVEVGRGQIRGDGSVGAWAAKFVTTFGVLPRGVYGDVDVSAYSESRCRLWGRNGLTPALEAEAKKYPVKDAALVATAAECKKALQNGYATAVCSNQGFTMQRDANGVCRASGSWGHCMCIDGYHREPNGKEYFHITNSWGANAHTGPVGWGEPNKAGFWAEAATVDRMLRMQDSFAYSGVTGFPPRKIVWEELHTRATPARPKNVGVWAADLMAAMAH